MVPMYPLTDYLIDVRGEVFSLAPASWHHWAFRNEPDVSILTSNQTDYTVYGIF